MENVDVPKRKKVPNWCIYMQIEGCSYDIEKVLMWDLIIIKTLAMARFWYFYATHPQKWQYNQN